MGFGELNWLMTCDQHNYRVQGAYNYTVRQVKQTCLRNISYMVVSCGYLHDLCGTESDHCFLEATSSNHSRNVANTQKIKQVCFITILSYSRGNGYIYICLSFSNVFDEILLTSTLQQSNTTMKSHPFIADIPLLDGDFDVRKLLVPATGYLFVGLLYNYPLVI